jgi:hypothetical protein
MRHLAGRRISGLVAKRARRGICRERRVGDERSGQKRIGCGAEEMRGRSMMEVIERRYELA